MNPSPSVLPSPAPSDEPSPAASTRQVSPEPEPQSRRVTEAASVQPPQLTVSIGAAQLPTGEASPRTHNQTPNHSLANDDNDGRSASPRATILAASSQRQTQTRPSQIQNPRQVICHQTYYLVCVILCLSYLAVSDKNQAHLPPDTTVLL